MYSLIKQLLLPPTGLLLVLFAGLLWSRQQRLRRWLIGFSGGSLFLLSLPCVNEILMTGLEPYPALLPQHIAQTSAQAIVVLSGDTRPNAAEFGRPIVGYLTLQRLHYTAWLYHQTGLPIIVSGGHVTDKTDSVAQLMARVLWDDFHTPVYALEEHSVTTRENAIFTAELLRQHNWQRVLLVTHAWHMPRAVAAFTRTGIDVVPAPTAFEHDKTSPFEWHSLIPNAKAFLFNYYAVHEYIGQFWYVLTATFYAHDSLPTETPSTQDITL